MSTIGLGQNKNENKMEQRITFMTLGVKEFER